MEQKEKYRSGTKRIIQANTPFSYSYINMILNGDRNADHAIRSIYLELDRIESLNDEQFKVEKLEATATIARKNAEIRIMKRMLKRKRSKK